MQSTQIDIYGEIIREHQEEIKRELKKQAMLNEGLAPEWGLKRRVLVSLAFTVVVVTVAIFTGAQFV